ncbi:GNAT family N-acetyltransferase [Devosia insulae DS-56]|uniref:GNAT family N-acetyltransferase n=2 Tax=Devosia insulae TaxID=408174 RepID=A0A1E5XN05_9HYPH|nr:GNAT family N-acetyltransferase [Devosia insulae DS-56]
MLSMASYPPDLQVLGVWFADHPRQWEAGEAYRFAVEHEAQFIGLVDIDGISEGQGKLGYWFDRGVWGRGFASEAAAAVVRFAFAEAGLKQLQAGHAADNAASAKVLLKLGFEPLETVELLSHSRAELIQQRRYLLNRPVAG